MFGIEIIEVGIGLALTYLSLATLCSAIVEIFVKLTSYRSKMLRGALIKLLGQMKADTAAGKGQLNVAELVDSMYKHHLIHGRTMSRSAKPDYIDKLDFAEALVDACGQIHTGSEKSEAVRQALSRIPDEKLRTRLINMLDDSLGDITAFKQKVADWFDKSMTDVSFWFKSKMRLFVTITSAVVVTLLNVDSLELANKLYKDNNLREATVTAAQSYIAETELNTTGKADTDSTKGLLELVHDVDSLMQATKMLPIGWDNEKYPWELGKTGMEDFKLLMIKLFGLLITIGAVSMGAPYWRDQLKGLLSYRFGKSGSAPAAEAAPAQPITVVVAPQPLPPVPNPPAPAAEAAKAASGEVEESPDTEIV